MEVKLDVQLTEAEILRINPQPGEVLFVKFKGDMFTESDVDDLGKQLRPFFPNNKVIVVTLPSDHDIELTAVANQDKVESADCSQPNSYCDNCNCGKKEQIEGT